LLIISEKRIESYSVLGRGSSHKGIYYPVVMVTFLLQSFTEIISKYKHWKWGLMIYGTQFA